MSKKNGSGPKRKKTYWYDPEFIEIVETLEEELANKREYPNVSQGEIVRHIVDIGLENWDGTSRGLIPDEFVEKYQTVRDRERQKASGRVEWYRATWQRNCVVALNKLLADPEPAEPKYVTPIMEKYANEALNYFDGQELDRKLSWLNDQLEGYKDAWRAKQIVPEGDPWDHNDQVALGRDLMSLIDQGPDKVVGDIEAIAESYAYDADAILDRLAADFAVEIDAIELVLDAIVRDDVDPRRALKGLEDPGSAFEDFVSAKALEERVEEVPLIEDPDNARKGGWMPSGITAEDLNGHTTEEIVTEIDPEAIREEMGVPPQEVNHASD